MYIHMYKVPEHNTVKFQLKIQILYTFELHMYQNLNRTLHKQSQINVIYINSVITTIKIQIQRFKNI